MAWIYLERQLRKPAGLVGRTATGPVSFGLILPSRLVVLPCFHGSGGLGNFPGHEAGRQHGPTGLGNPIGWPPWSTGPELPRARCPSCHRSGGLLRRPASQPEGPLGGCLNCRDHLSWPVGILPRLPGLPTSPGIALHRSTHYPAK